MTNKRGGFRTVTRADFVARRKARERVRGIIFGARVNGNRADATITVGTKHFFVSGKKEKRAPVREANGYNIVYVDTTTLYYVEQMTGVITLLSRTYICRLRC